MPLGRLESNAEIAAGARCRNRNMTRIGHDDFDDSNLRVSAPMAEARLLVAPPLQSLRLYKQIASVLEGWIRAGVYPPGSNLPSERDLAQMLKVSRTSVREALIALEVNDLVMIRVGSGVEVRPAARSADAAKTNSIEERSPLEQLEARRLVEGEIAALAAKHASDADLARLSASIKATQRPLTTRETFLAADHDFHQILAQAANHLVFMDVSAQLWSLRRQPAFKKFEEHYTGDAAERSTVIEEHERIFEAVRGRNPREARRRMHAHLDRILRSFVG